MGCKEAALTDGGHMVQGYNSLQRQMSRSNFDDLYASAKTLLCCTLANRVRHAWIAWTCAAALTGMAPSTLCPGCGVPDVCAQVRIPSYVSVGIETFGHLSPN